MIHFHKYKLIGVQKGYGKATDSLTLTTTDNVPMTSLLYKCRKCGKVKQKNIEGQWDEMTIKE